jgi:hypothetical protein
VHPISTNEADLLRAFLAMCRQLLLLLLIGNCAATNPVTKVVQLLGDLEAKVTAEGVAEEKAFQTFSAWCTDASRNTGFQIKTATSDKEALEATIVKATNDVGVATSKISDLASAIQSDEADLKAAATIRAKEKQDFGVAEAELVEAISTLDRAIAIIERKMHSEPALLQKVDSGNFQAMLHAIDTVIDAAALSSTDGKRLTALVQNKQSEDDGELGAPAAAVYKTHSMSIVNVLEDLQEKAESQLSDLRKAEMNQGHNFGLLKQSIEDQVGADSKDLEETKSGKAAAQETKAEAQGDLAVTVKDLQNAKSSLSTINSDCKTAAADHETSKASRAEELAALAQAKEIITSSASGATAQSYSFLQFDAGTVSATGSKLHSHSDLIKFEIVTMVKRLAKEQHSTALSQLASRIAAVVRYGSGGSEDPFVKVKQLISEMIGRLEGEASSEASHKSYCDDEIRKTAEKKSELTNDVAKLTSKIDKAASAEAKLKDDVAELHRNLASLARSQAEMDNARREEAAVYAQAKTDLEQGISAVQQATNILRSYYGAAFVQQPEAPGTHDAASGAGNSIISILEVVLSDFSKSLAKADVAEQESQMQYDTMTQKNKITKAVKDQDLKYKSREIATLAKTIAESSSDRQGLSAELDAVLEYGQRLNEQCVAKAETYEDRSRRREAEIAGLKQALQILEGEAFVQQHGKGRRLRHSSMV